MHLFIVVTIGKYATISYSPTKPLMQAKIIFDVKSATSPANIVFSKDLVQSSGKVLEQFKELVANIVKEGGKPNLAD